MAPKHLRKKMSPQPPKVQAALDAATQVSSTDPMGSYTAQPRSAHAKPVQDADDL